MRNKLIAFATLSLAAVSVAAAPMIAQAAPHRHKVWVCDHAGRNARNTGTAVGAVAGGLLGNAVSHNAGGTIIGAGVGAVAGHQIAKSNGKKCHYEWRTY